MASTISSPVVAVSLVVLAWNVILVLCDVMASCLRTWLLIWFGAFVEPASGSRTVL